MMMDWQKLEPLGVMEPQQPQKMTPRPEPRILTVEEIQVNRDKISILLMGYLENPPNLQAHHKAKRLGLMTDHQWKISYLRDHLKWLIATQKVIATMPDADMKTVLQRWPMEYPDPRNLQILWNLLQWQRLHPTRPIEMVAAGSTVANLWKKAVRIALTKLLMVTLPRHGQEMRTVLWTKQLRFPNRQVTKYMETTQLPLAKKDSKARPVARSHRRPIATRTGR